MASLAHETNTFSPLPTTMRSFREGVFLQSRKTDLSFERVQALVPAYAGIFDAAASHGDEVLIGLSAWAQPGGPVSRLDYEALRDELLGDLAAVGPVDAVVLLLHGAMVAEDYPDCEGDLLGRVRGVVGPRVPIGALLDLHGNISPAMIESGSILVACKEYPHTDYRQRGRELYTIVSEAARSGETSYTIMRGVPMLGIFGTTEGPMRDFVQCLIDCELQPDVQSVSAMHGFPWSDTVYTSACILIVCKANSSATTACESLADVLAAEFLNLGTVAQSNRFSIDVALDAAVVAEKHTMVVLADGSDNPGGGAACDSTFVLSALLERGIRDAALGMIWDPQAVAIATDAGVGARLPLRIGGKVGPLSGQPIDLYVEVTACRADAYQRGLDPGSRDALGPAVAVRADGIDIVLNSVRQQVFSPDCFTELGIDLATKRLIVVKSTQHFRAGFDALGATVIYCDAPGSLNSDLAKLPYRLVTRPIWPLDLSMITR